MQADMLPSFAVEASRYTYMSADKAQLSRRKNHISLTSSRMTFFRFIYATLIHRVYSYSRIAKAGNRKIYGAAAWYDYIFRCKKREEKKQVLHTRGSVSVSLSLSSLFITFSNFHLCCEMKNSHKIQIHTSLSPPLKISVCTELLFQVLTRLHLRGIIFLHLWK